MPVPDAPGIGISLNRWEPTNGLKALLTGREFGRDKPTRYGRVVA